MQGNDGGQVDLGQHIAIEDHHRFGQLVARVLDGTSRAERYRFDHVSDLDAGI